MTYRHYAIQLIVSLTVFRLAACFVFYKCQTALDQHSHTISVGVGLAIKVGAGVIVASFGLTSMGQRKPRCVDHTRELMLLPVKLTYTASFPMPSL